MKNYIGTKEILAKPMTLGEYNEYRGWVIPENENPNEDGYLVEYPNSDNKVHKDHEGYISWSPKKEFEEAYRETKGLTFGQALEAAKIGLKISRVGWNGSGMYAIIMPGYPDGIKVNEATRKAHNLPENSTLRYRPYFQLYTAQKDVAMWAPSGSDVLAEDWQIILKADNYEL